MRVCLTVAGSDSVAGAGIQADLKTFHHFGVYGVSVITSVTAQNTRGVQGVHNVPPEFIRAQLQSIFSDVRVDSVKLGMLSTKASVEAVAQGLAKHRTTNVVIDPVMVAKGGAVLLDEDARKELKATLLPLGKIVTPNIHEASWLSGEEIRTEEDMKRSAEIIHEFGVEWVLVKGGHLEGNVVDVLYDGKEMECLGTDDGKWEEVHGTGCVLSAGIAACLAKGFGVRDAVLQARSYLARAVVDALKIGSGWKVIAV